MGIGLFEPSLGKNTVTRREFLEEPEHGIHNTSGDCAQERSQEGLIQVSFLVASSSE